MSERLIYEGRLAELRLKAGELRTRCEGLRGAMCMHLAKVRPIEEMDGEVIASMGVEFGKARAELVTILGEMDEIKRILGR
jgi:hypothetical protein